LSDGDREIKEDAAHLLFDEARILDGEQPADPRMFCDRMARVLRRGLGKPGAVKVDQRTDLADGETP
jgi:molecular chaperone HtpG